MKTLAIVLVAALAAAVPATAYAAPAVSSAQGPPQPCDLVDCERVLWVVRCVGDALGGHACHGAATTAAATPDPEAVVSCVGTAVRNWLDGVTPEMCTVNAAAAAQAPDVGKAVQCTKTAVRNVVDGVTPMPCDV